MKIDAQQVKAIANLARIEIDEKDIEQYSEDLTKILTLFTILNQHNMVNVEPMSHPLDVSQRLRQDDVTENITENDQFERLQALAPRLENHLYLVPKVIE